MLIISTVVRWWCGSRVAASLRYGRPSAVRRDPGAARYDGHPPNATHSTTQILNSPFPELSTNVPNSTYVCIVACQDAASYQRRKCDAEI
jgi:hypothetical protein